MTIEYAKYLYEHTHFIEYAKIVKMYEAEYRLI